MAKHRLGVWLLIGAICLAFGGCVKAKVLNVTTFNKTMTLSRSCKFMRTSPRRTSAKLKHIWQCFGAQKNLIINPMSVRLQFYTPTVFERLSQHDYRQLALGAVMEKEPETLTTSADLDSIKVVPGEFFLNEFQNLCYYQQTEIPGKAVDAVMQEMVPVIASELAKFAEREIERSSTAGSQKVSWNDLRELLSQSLEEKETTRTGENVQGPLEMASLRLMLKANADKSVQFTRKANDFTLVLPLSARDVEEAITTMNLATTIVAERLKAGKTVDKHVQQLLKATEVNRTGKDGLSVTVHIERVMRVVNADSTPIMATEGYQNTWAHLGGAFYVTGVDRGTF